MSPTELSRYLFMVGWHKQADGKHKANKVIIL